MKSYSPEIINFVSCLLYESDNDPMTTDDACYNIAAWICEGWELPEGLTPAVLAELWNELIEA